MKNLRLLVVLTVLLPSLLIHAAKKADYQTGRLVDFRAYATGAGALRAQYSFCLAIQTEDISYIVRYETFSRGSYQPTNLVVGDPIDIKIKDDNLYFKKSPDGEAKGHIVRRERVAPDSKPTTCALPVTTQ